MPKFTHFLLLLSFILAVNASESTNVPRVDYPRAGDTVQGLVAISGQTEVEGFLFSEVFFGYSGNSEGEWFLITMQDQAVRNGLITSWDTTTISDGAYNLRVVVHLENGTELETVVNNLEVRNFTGDDLSSRASEPSDLAVLSATGEVPIKQQTATPSPVNPAEITTDKYRQMLINGILIVLAFFIVLWTYLRLRRMMRNR
jgi:hypothetical protein